MESEIAPEMRVRKKEGRKREKGEGRSGQVTKLKGGKLIVIFFFKRKTAYEIGL